MSIYVADARYRVIEHASETVGEWNLIFPFFRTSPAAHSLLGMRGPPMSRFGNLDIPPHRFSWKLRASSTVQSVTL